MDLVLREASFPQDDALCAGFIDALQAYERALEADRRVDDEAGRDWLAELKRQISERNGFVRIAMLDGSPAGWIVCLEDDDPLYIEAGQRTLFSVQELYLDERARGQGIGRAMLQCAEDEGRRRGRARLSIGVLHRNEPAHGTYAAFGFRDYARWMIKPLN